MILYTTSLQCMPMMQPHTYFIQSVLFCVGLKSRGKICMNLSNDNISLNPLGFTVIRLHIMQICFLFIHQWENKPFTIMVLLQKPKPNMQMLY